MAVVRLILRLSSSDHGLRPRCPLCYASSSVVLRLRLRCRGNHCTTPKIKVATLSECAQALGTHAVRRGSRDPLYSLNGLLKAKQVVYLVVSQVPLALIVGPLM